MKKRRIVAFLSALIMLAAALAGCRAGASDKRADLISDGGAVAPLSPNAGFSAAYTDLALKLLSACLEDGKNTLVSPLSVMEALAMMANGACGETLGEMERVIGGGIPVSELARYLAGFAAGGEELSLANSLWLREGFDIDEEFLRKCSAFQGAGAYRAPFDRHTVDDINDWVSENTHGMIKSAVDYDTVRASELLLCNALYFDGKWERRYSDGDISDGYFTRESGARDEVRFMYSEEHSYLDDGKATGFIKPYKSGYSFVALLPNEDVSLSDYVASMTGGTFIGMIKNAKDVPVETAIPKFSYDYDIEMSGALKALGMTKPFDAAKADFSALGYYESGNIFISRVLHKAYITVDEKGTKAGAATAADIKATSDTGGLYSVTLDRSFVYAVIDDAYGLPVFIGAVTDIGK